MRRAAVLLLASGLLLSCTRQKGPGLDLPYSDATPPGAPAGAADVARRDRSPQFDEPLTAARTRYEQRLSADGTMPPNALIVAKVQRDRLIAAQAGRGPATRIVWRWLGPGNIGGRLRGILIHPTQPNIMWVGSVSGGVWKTVNAGARWDPLDDFLPSLTIGCMALDPQNPDVLYVGTGEGFFNTVEGTSNTAAIRGAGIFRSRDGGNTWVQLPSTVGPDWYFVNRIAIARSDPRRILAATQTGLWRSTDGGQSWSQVIVGRMFDVRLHPVDDARCVAGGALGDAYYSTDGGATWTPATGIAGRRVELAYARGDPSIVYAAVHSGANRLRVFRSQDGGVSYTLQTAGSGISTLADYTGAIWVDPANSNRLLVGGQALYRSTDGGVTLVGAFSSVHADHHVLIEHPGYDGVNNRRIYMGNDGGIYTAADVNTNSAQELNNNLGVTQFYGAAINPTTGVVLAGAQDNGTSRYTGGTETWSMTFGGDGGFCAADPTDPNYFYGEVQRALIFRSTNGGASGSYIYSGISDAGTLNANFIPYFLLDPNDPNRMLVAARRIWRSNNVKGPTPTWTAIKPTIEPPPLRRPVEVPELASGKPGRRTTGESPETPQDHFAANSPWNASTIAIAEGNSDIVWVGYNNGQVWMTRNGTAGAPTWVRVDDNPPGLPDRWISRIAIDRRNPDRVYVAILGYEPDNVWRTTDGGATWQRITGDPGFELPSIPVAALALHRTLPGVIYAGTDLGLFVSRDDGSTWSASTEGPGTVAIDELVWKNNRELMAVTHGRGVFLGDVGEPVGDLTGDGCVNQADLGVLLSCYGTGPCGDLDGDGDTDQADLGILLANWGLGCP